MNPKDSNDQTWQIKTMVNCHTCSKSVSNSNITSKWMANYYIGKFMSEPNYTLRSLRHDVLHEFGTLVSPGKCGRARDAALEMIEGNHKAQYGRIYDYLQELGSTNPGTTTICYLDLRLFRRMYVCPQACKDGWKVGCRRIIGLDGCFLKGYFQGYLLTAVGIDANDCIYPIAYAVVESENMSSWHWFVEILQTDLEIDNSFNICFMSDRQKGLKEVIEDIFPYAEDRKCVRHIYTNFKEKHKGQALKDVVWKAARATYLREFENAMDQLKSLSEAAYIWIKGKNPAQWSRSHFSTRSKCGMLLNNHCESFNKSILEARDKPILTLMETIRVKIMTRIVSKREAAEKYKGLLCGKIQKKLDASIEESIRFWPTYAGVNTYQVEAGPSHQHVVDLDQRSCPNQWDLVTNMEPILPPIIRRPPGRPTKKRRLESDEVTNPKLSKRGQQGNCTKCGKQGHNRRTCRGKVGANQPIRRPTMRRPKPKQPQQPPIPAREKIPIRRTNPLPPPTTTRWMPSQESTVSNPPTQESQSFN
ncbi:hypothetical protein V6N13_110380 [Hibiscus sabdariffa]